MSSLRHDAAVPGRQLGTEWEMPDSGLDRATASVATGRQLGVLIVGMGGAVATTAAVQYVWTLQ